jgi:hypothetical protein
MPDDPNNKPEKDCPFICPLCGSDGYVAIHVKRPGGNWYRTPFYRCFGCSVVFTQPRAFTQQRKLTRVIREAMGGALMARPQAATYSPFRRAIAAC